MSEFSRKLARVMSTNVRKQMFPDRNTRLGEVALSTFCSQVGKVSRVEQRDL